MKLIKFGAAVAACLLTCMALGNQLIPKSGAATAVQLAKPSPVAAATPAAAMVSQPENALEERIAVLETRVSDQSQALGEQTALFSFIAAATLALFGMFTYRDLKARFSKKVDTATDKLMREDAKREGAMMKRIDKMVLDLKLETASREDTLSQQIAAATETLNKRIGAALSEVYRAHAYALEGDTPDVAIIWTLRCLREHKQASENNDWDVEWMGSRLDEAIRYSKRVTEKAVFTSFSNEGIEILDMLRVHSEISEKVKQVRVEFNRILSLSK